jgi:hypothetical protein
MNYSGPTPAGPEALLEVGKVMRNVEHRARSWSSAVYDGKALVMSLGRDSVGQRVWVHVTATQREAETIATLLASSGLNTLAAHQ